MTAKRLTREMIERAKPTAARQEIRDAVIPGLRLVVQPTGVKSWALRYTVGERDRKMTLGNFPGLSLEEARKAAAVAKGDIIRGIDPAAVKLEARRTGTTVDDIWSEYEALHLSKKRSATAGHARGLFVKRLLPVWGRVGIADIKRRDVMAVLDSMSAIPAAQNRAKAVLSHFFNWALEREIIDASPCGGVKRPNKPQARKRVLTDDELRKLWNVCYDVGFPFGPMVRMLILTGARRTEVAAMAWDELQFDQRLFVLPKARSKTNNDHETHLSGAALEVLNSVPRFGRFVFSARNDKAVSGFSKAKSRIDSLMGEGVAPWTFHDIRRTVGTRMQRIKIRREVIEACLNHVAGGIIGVYQTHDYGPEKVVAFDTWAAEVHRIVTGAGSNVLPMTRSVR